LDFAGAQAEIDLAGLGIADTTKMRSIPDARHEEDVDDLSGHAILS
jgi:hypothetical protein